MSSSRSEYVAKNVSITLAMQIVKNLLGFVNRTVFVYILGAEYLGVNSLFTDILTVLSFAELGIGNAMVFSLYKPIARGDQEKIKSLMKLYAKTYQIIGIVIAGLGICLVPFIGHIVGDVSYIKENIILLYLLFLLNSVISYFFVYKKSLIIACQKNYIVDIYQQIFYAFQVVVQILFLAITKQFIIYLMLMVATTFLNNYFVAKKADKMYPFLKEKNIAPLEKNEIYDIIKNVKALVVYKIGGIILESTDSIFISSIINVVTVGLYANYKIVVDVFRTIGSQVMNSIVASVGNLNAGDDTEKKEKVFNEMFYISNYKIVVDVFRTIGSQVMNSIVASVGNLNAGDDTEKKEKVFNEMFYISSWFYGFATAGLCCFLSPLVSVWLGNKYVIGFDAVLAACVYFYISNMHYPCYTYRTTAGLFVFGKYVPMFSAIINIILDIVMGKLWGLAGILWASSIARIVTYDIILDIVMGKLWGLAGILWASSIARIVTYELIDPIIVYKKVFNKPVIKYFFQYAMLTVLIVVDAIVSYRVSFFVLRFDGFMGLICRAVLFSVIFNVVFFLTTFKTPQFKSLMNRGKSVWKKMKTKGE